LWGLKCVSDLLYKKNSLWFFILVVSMIHSILIMHMCETYSIFYRYLLMKYLIYKTLVLL